MHLYNGAVRLLKAAKAIMTQQGVTPVPGMGYTFSNQPYEDLIIHVITDNLWKLTHFRTNGNVDLSVGLLFDTDAVEKEGLLDGVNRFVLPTYIWHGWLEPQRFVYVKDVDLTNPLPSSMVMCAKKGMEDVGEEFGRTWATNLHDQGFFTTARDKQDRKPTITGMVEEAIEGSHPVMAVLPEWMHSYQKNPAGTIPFIIEPDGSIAHYPPKNGTDYNLRELQQIVEGSIEPMYLPSGDLMIINEDGYEVLPVNPVASVLIRSLYRQPTQKLYGRVIVIRNEMLK